LRPPAGSIGLLEALEKTMLIEIASAIYRTDGHLAVSAQRIHGAGVPRRSVIIGRQFGAENRNQFIIKAESMNWDRFSLDTDFRCAR
jgi:hypothetical protein